MSLHSGCVHIYMHACVSVCMSAHVYARVHVYMCTLAYLCMSMFVCVWVLCACTHVSESQICSYMVENKQDGFVKTVK